MGRNATLGGTLKRGAKRALKGKNLAQAAEAALVEYDKTDSILKSVGKGTGQVIGNFLGLEAGQRRNVKNFVKKGASTYVPILADAAVRKLFKDTKKDKKKGKYDDLIYDKKPGQKAITYEEAMDMGID
jgi:hypothetical protein